MNQEIARAPSRGHSKLQVSLLPFSAIPHQSRLFIEYLRDPISLKRYYPEAADSPSQIGPFIPKVLANYGTDRAELCAALTEINSKIGAAEATFENIRLLGDPDAVAVVTGQQAGLFAGPLFTIYKALSAIKMAETLKESGTKAVPVFWAATEDHDFDEVSETFFIGKEGEVFRSKYQPAGYVKDSSVGSVEIDGDISRNLDEVFAELPTTEFSTEIRDLLEASWQPGTRFGEAFEKNLAAILSKFGLIMIDPMHATIKQLSSPIYADAIARSDEIIASVRKRSLELERDGFHAQVLVEDDYFPLFWHDDAGRRTALRKVRDGVYGPKGDRRGFATSELEKIAVTEPQRFSPGVMLRPVVQDYLLPTVSYFGGSAEIAYFAQNSEVYRILDRPVTPIFHRQSFTLIESKHRKVLDKLDLILPSLFDGLEKIQLSVVADGVSPETGKLFADVENKIHGELDRLDETLSRIDPTLAENLAKRRDKVIYHIAAVRKKSLLALARKDETVDRQLHSVFAALLPNGQLQERSLNAFYFLNKFGLNFIDWLYGAIDLEDKDHRMVDL